MLTPGALSASWGRRCASCICLPTSCNTRTPRWPSAAPSRCTTSPSSPRAPWLPTWEPPTGFVSDARLLAPAAGHCVPHTRHQGLALGHHPPSHPLHQLLGSLAQHEAPTQMSAANVTLGRQPPHFFFFFCVHAAGRFGRLQRRRCRRLVNGATLHVGAGENSAAGGPLASRMYQDLQRHPSRARTTLTAKKAARQPLYGTTPCSSPRPAPRTAAYQRRAC